MNLIAKFFKKYHLTFDRCLLGFAGLGLTVTSGYCSVVGFNELFGNAGAVVTVLAIFLECGKVAVTGFLFTHWASAKTIQKIYMSAALAILMVISGAGAFGFFQDAFNHSQIRYQDATVQTSGTQALIDDAGSRIADATGIITEAQAEISALRKQVDSLPGDYAKSRTLAANRIAPEVAMLTARIQAAQETRDKATSERRALVDSMTTAKLTESQARLNAGPFMAIASKLGVSVESLATIFICLLVTVFDPLAVSLIGAFAMTGKMAKDARKTRNAAISKRRAKTVKKDAVKSMETLRRLGQRAVGLARLNLMF